MSLDHLVRASEDGGRDYQAKDAGVLEVEGEVVSDGPLDGQAIRRGALEEPIDVAGGPAKVVVGIRSIRHESSFVNEGSGLVHGGDSMLLGKLDDALSIEKGEGVCHQNSASGRFEVMAEKAISKSFGSWTPRGWTVTCSTCAAFSTSR